MEPFQTLIDFIELERGNNPDGWAPIVVKRVCEAYTGHEPPEDLGQLDTFLRLFIEAVRTEQKRDFEKRATAIEVILDWATRYWDDHGRDPVSLQFPGVRLLPFAFQLALRVRKPALFNQGGTGLCGTVALVYTFGKELPLGLAQFGINLFHHGEGLFRLLQVTPSQSTRTKFNSRKSKTRLCEADYVIMVSVRECGGSSNLGQSFHIANQTLTAGTICNMLDQSGYVNVQDHTFINTGGMRKQVERVLNQQLYFENHHSKVTDTGDRTQKILNLLDAQRELEQGRFVLVLGHSDISKVLGNQGTRIPYNVFSHNLISKTIHRHWTAMRRIRVTVQQDLVELKLISWGERVQGTINLTDFLDVYEGYVSASP